MSVELNDAIRDLRAAISHAYGAVSDISCLLEEVGLTKLSKRLDYAMNDLPELAKAVSGAYSEKLHRDISYSEKMTGNMMLLALQKVGENHGN